MAYGDMLGMYDVWQMERFMKRLPVKRIIVVVRERPLDRVIEEAKNMSIELVYSDFPRKIAQEIASELKKAGQNARIKRLEEIADRSIMSDPC